MASDQKRLGGRFALRWGSGIALVVVALSLVGCGKIATALVDEERERSLLGDSAAASLAEQYRMLSADHPASVWAHELVQPLIEESARFQDPAAYEGYEISVIDDDELVNAFAVPGGYLYLTTGLIREAGHCAEIAGVLGHEIAHVTERHGVKQMGNRLGLRLTVALVTGGDASFFANVGEHLVANGFSRRAERQADEVGLQIVEGAGYNPAGMVAFFERISGGRMERLLAFASTHPASEKRSEELREQISESWRGVSLEERGGSCIGTSRSLAEIQQLL